MFNIEPQKVLHLWKEEEKKTPKLHGRFIESIKLNGWYVYIDFDPRKGWSEIHSSAMRPIPAFEKYKEQFDIFETGVARRLIAEAIIPGMDFFEMNGLFNRSAGNCHANGVEFHFHDMLVIPRLNTTAIDRYRELEDFVCHKQTETIKLHPTRNLRNYTKEVWYEIFNEVVEAGEEGLVFKRADSIYTPGKKNSDLVKMKMEDTFDLLCKRMYWTKGEKGNDNLNLDLENKLGIITPVRIGKYSDIAEFQRDSPVGKVIEIKAMMKTKYGNYKEPRFNRVRGDKLPKDID
jgi:hypothetical protein